MKTKVILLTALFAIQVIAMKAQNAEKIVLTTDKQWYYPGENLWFSLNVFDACANAPSNRSKIAYVELVGSDNKPVQQVKVLIHNASGDGSFAINENITTGNYNVVAYTNWMKNFGTGSYSGNNIQIVNPSKMAPINVAHKEEVGGVIGGSSFKVVPAKEFYGKREYVPVKITGAPSSRLSVSVFRIDALQKGIGDINEVSANPCPDDTRAAQSFIIEDRGQIITGRIIDKRTQQPAPSVRGYLSVSDSPNELFVATSDSTGTIRFEVGELAGRRELVLQTNHRLDSNYSIEIINPYSDQVFKVDASQKENVFEKMPGVVNEGLVSAQVQNLFYSGVAAGTDTIFDSGVPFYGKPDAFYLMSDYVRFTTVEEIFREYITLVGVQRRNGRLVPIVYDLLSERATFPDPPLILVNGVPLFEADRLMDMNTEEFFSIGVVAKKYFIGHQSFDGIIDVRLTNDSKNFGRNVTVVDYEGVSNADKFYSPVYSNELERKSRKPDFRNVLYWNPGLQKDKDGNYSFDFYSSDLEGDYAIVVRSISESGKIETSQTVIQVK